MVTTRTTLTRRKLVTLAATTLVVLTAIVWAGAAYTSAGTSGVRAGQSVGMYSESDPSTANQAATFTINPLMLSCGVAAEDIEGLGRFEMLMYSTRIKRYLVDSARKAITARGEMRSITRVGGVVVEDARHPFIAHALDLDGDEGEQDRFDVHFRTPFWSPGQPMCTPSNRHPGLCRIGGQLLAGNVNVAEVRSDDDNEGEGRSSAARRAVCRPPSYTRSFLVKRSGPGEPNA